MKQKKKDIFDCTKLIEEIDEHIRVMKKLRKRLNQISQGRYLTKEEVFGKRK